MTTEIIQKGQALRVADVILIGPAMIAGGLYMAQKDSRLTFQLFGTVLALMGTSTMIFNADNYRKQQEVLEREQRQQAETPQQVAI